MKAFLIAAALTLAPAAASAQVAAATVPNTFDRPGQTPTPAPAAPASPARSTTPANAASEQMLRDFIAAVQADAIDYSVFTDDLVPKIREQAGPVGTLIKGFGAVQAVDFVGAENQTDLYAVTFATAATEWMIGIRDGKIAALLFRPANAAGS